MPRYHGHLNESLEAYFYQAYKYCQPQNITMNKSQRVNYVISLIIANLRYAVAVCYHRVEYRNSRAIE